MHREPINNQLRLMGKPYYSVSLDFIWDCGMEGIDWLADQRGLRVEKGLRSMIKLVRIHAVLLKLKFDPPHYVHV